MLSYELALSLKNAGFPDPETPTGGNYDLWVIQKTRGLAYCVARNEEILLIRLDPGITYHRGYIYIPTLSELIDACEGGLEELTYKHHRIAGGLGERIWKAWGIEMEPWNPASNQMGQGESPEIAVANLWLKQNPKIT